MDNFTQQSSQTGGSWFNTAQASASALSMGTAMEVIQLSTYLQSLSYKELEQLLTSEKDASTGFANTIEAALKEQASATRSQAYGMLVGGATQIGLEGAALGYSLVATARSNMSELQTKLGNAESWEKELDNSAKGSLRCSNKPPVPASEGDVTVIRNRLRAADIKATPLWTESIDPKTGKPVVDSDNNPVMKPAGTFAGDIARLQLESNDSENVTCLADLRKRATAQREAVEKQIEGVQSQIESRRGRISQLGVAVGQMVNGGYMTQQAQRLAQQAVLEGLKQAFQYVVSSIQSANSSTGQNAANLGANINTNIQTLLAGVAQSNQIRG